VVCPQLPAEHPQDSVAGEGGRPRPAWTGTGPVGLGAGAALIFWTGYRLQYSVQS
jgi:hypothetical protein